MAFISTPLPFSRPTRSQALCTRRVLSPRRARAATAVPTMALNVVVTGAGGLTGSMVLKLLRDDPDVRATGVVRDMARAAERLGTTDDLVLADITRPETLGPALEGQDALVVLTSAQVRQGPPAEEGGRPTLYFDEGQFPEEIDWIGQRNQVDAAKAAGVKHVVLVGSMGMTDENHMLNRIGNGNVLRFKLKAELYLKDSGLPYTIINPGGLNLNPPGERELIVGTNDELFELYGVSDCNIPRGDVARVVVAALKTESAKNKWFDLVSRPVGTGSPTADPAVLFDQVPVPTL